MAYAVIIPARGGSKGVPGKNIRPFATRSLLEYAIQAAIDAEVTENVFVTTDSHEIRDRALAAGAKAPFIRPTDLADDAASMFGVVEHAVREIVQLHGDVTSIILLQPTSPFRTPDDIKSAVRSYEVTQADSLVSVCDVPHQFTPESLMRLVDGAVHFEKLKINARQNKEKYLARNGPAILITSVDTVLRGSLYGNKTIPFHMNKLASIDIDDIEDFEIAEVLKINIEKK